MLEQGGLPPDSVVESIDAILAASQDAVERFHDPSPGAMVRLALAPWAEVPLRAAESIGTGSMSQRAFDAASELVVGLFRAGFQRL